MSDQYRPWSVAGDSANHARVDYGIANANNSRSTIVVELQQNDALFIPEGWWHAVESSPQTIGILFDFFCIILFYCVCVFCF